jgi:hypothetical protein
MKYGRITAALGVLTLTGCARFMHPSYEYDDVSRKRVPDQTAFEDSAFVFFAEYPNPYENQEVLWIASFMDGPVEMSVHDMETDSVVAVYRFAAQEAPLYPMVYRSDPERLVKCVVLVGGRSKCAKIFPWIYPLPFPQWGTTYTIETPR